MSTSDYSRRNFLKKCAGAAGGFVLSNWALPVRAGTRSNITLGLNLASSYTLLLGRPTDSSVTVSVIPDVDLEAYFEYGTEAGTYTGQTAPTTSVAGDPIESVIDNLQANTRYYYRMRYRQPGEPEFNEADEHTFHTQRPPGSTFTFTVQADSHLYDKKCTDELYRISLQNALADAPDFHLDLGDTFGADKLYYAGTLSYEAVAQRHLDQRPFFGLIGPSAPLFLVLGNHEGEWGCFLDGSADNMTVWATQARKLYYPNPFPDGFYSGNTITEPHVGLPHNYYAWQWGDALFVALDVYRHATADEKPKKWDFTLGYDQYNWFKQILEQSDAKFKFVFAHHVRGQCRGAITTAPYYEWGGLNDDDTWGFDSERIGWYAPIHQLMVENNVTIFFQGHDHLFAKEELDGIVYQEVPMPSDATYVVGMRNAGNYPSGDVLPNSGHLRIKVCRWKVTVDYISAYPPEDEDAEHTNGQVVYSYTIMADGLLGDFNDDNSVNWADIKEFASQWLSDGGGSANLDCDSDVDFADFALLAENWSLGP